MAREVRRLLGLYADNEDLISVGAYRPGSNPDIDRAIQMKPRIDQFLQQQIYEKSTFEQTLAKLKALLEK